MHEKCTMVKYFLGMGVFIFVMKTVRKNCRNGNCRESWTGYTSWGKGRKMELRFSRSGEEAIERTYATHFLKPDDSAKMQNSNQEPVSGS